jgi:hypothetical protein
MIKAGSIGPAFFMDHVLIVLFRRFVHAEREFVQLRSKADAAQNGFRFSDFFRQQDLYCGIGKVSVILSQILDGVFNADIQGFFEPQINFTAFGLVFLSRVSFRASRNEALA